MGINNYIDISENAEITIEEGVTINESNNIALKKNGQFIIGRNTYITRATIACYEKIEIDENCILGEGMKIFDHNHQYTTEPFSVSKTEFNTAPVNQSMGQAIRSVFKLGKMKEYLGDKWTDGLKVSLQAICPHIVTGKQIGRAHV